MLTELVIVSGPNKTEYAQGEELDLTGLIVEAHYSGGEIQKIQEGQDGYTVGGYDPQRSASRKLL